MTRHPVGVELFRENTWPDITKLIVAFCNFVNVPKKVYTLPPPNSWINHVTVEVLHISIIFFFSFLFRNLHKCTAFTKQIIKESTLKGN